jgi:putative membrane protein
MNTTLKLLAAALIAAGAPLALAQDAPPNDAQIAGIVVVANTVDIEAGRQAESKSHNDAVKAFAKQMVTDHTAVNQQATSLVQKLNVTPQDSATSKSLKDGGAATLAKLAKLDGRAFDKAYVDNEVGYHEAVIGAVDKVLIPNAKNAELKATLVKVRPALVAHLEHARHIQASLK